MVSDEISVPVGYAAIVATFAELDQPPAERHRSKLLVAVALYCSGIDGQLLKNMSNLATRTFVVVDRCCALRCRGW
jgi:hypothetical protein